MQLNEEDKNIVISKISENEFLGEELSSFTDNFSKSKSFIFGMGSGKQLEKILYYNNYEALLDPEQKNINKMLIIAGVTFIVILIALMLMSVSPGWSFTVATAISIIFVFGSKSMSSSLESRRIFRENKKEIEYAYLCSSKILENVEFILNTTKKNIIDYAETQPMVSLDEVKNNGFYFLPDVYISRIMDEESDKGKYEKIEVSNISSSSDEPSYLYKSKISNRHITSTILDID